MALYLKPKEQSEAGVVEVWVKNACLNSEGSRPAAPYSPPSECKDIGAMSLKSAMTEQGLMAAKKGSVESAQRSAQRVPPSQ
jgi:hypothetical protein